MNIGPHPQWADPERIVSLDPWGHRVAEDHAHLIAAGIDIRPTIAVTKAHINMPELKDAIAAGRLTPDGVNLFDNGDVKVTKAAVDPVWYLPGIAQRFGIQESGLRRALFEQTAGMFPDLVTRPDLKGLPAADRRHDTLLLRRSRSSARPKRRSPAGCTTNATARTYSAPTSVPAALPRPRHRDLHRDGAAGRVGLVVNPQGRQGAWRGHQIPGSNARKRQVGGDRAETYFARTECVAGVQDMRFQELMPDVFHWLGIRRIDRWASMSDMKHNALTAAGIDVIERVPIPDELIPADARVEIDAKMAAGYYTPTAAPAGEELTLPKGRGLDE